MDTSESFLIDIIAQKMCNINVMKNITFRIEENLLEKARKKSVLLNRSLNDLFLEWISDFSEENKVNLNYRNYLSKFGHIKIDKKLNRDEMNER